MAVGDGDSPSLNEEALLAFAEGVKRCLGRWTALQLAVQNEWGGSRSLLKADQLHSDIVNWIVQSRAPRYIDELESLLDDNMITLFNAEIEDGSIEEVAEQIMLLHEECLEGNYGRLELLSASSGGNQSVLENQESAHVDETSHETEPMVASGTGSTYNESDAGDMKGSLPADEDANGWQTVVKGKHCSRRK